MEQKIRLLAEDLALRAANGEWQCYNACPRRQEHIARFADEIEFIIKEALK